MSAISAGDEGDSLADLISRLAPTGSGEDLRAALSIAASLADPQIPQVITVITDGAFALPPLDDFPIEIDWRFVGEGGNNQAVLDLTLEGGWQDPIRSVLPGQPITAETR